MINPTAALSSARARRPFLDHLVRAYGRYQADTGDRLAAAVTFYWFLSLFPILLVAIAVLGFALGDGARTQVVDGLRGYLPGSLATTIGDVVQNSKGKAGVIGLVGTLLSGLGWIDALREAIRTIWHQNVTAGNFVTRKVLDIGILVGLFAVIGASVIVGGAATTSTGSVLSLLGTSDTPVVRMLTSVVGYGVGGAVDTALFLYLFSRLARVRSPLRRIFKGALFGAVAFELVKFGGAYYVARTTSKGEATYGTFAVVVGLLLFLNLISRVVLLAAAFTVTAPYDSDVAPSGTASAQQADKAGIPQEYADNDPDDPPTLMDDGAPTPLRAAVQGRTPPQDEPTGRDAEGATTHPAGPAGSGPAGSVRTEVQVSAPAQPGPASRSWDRVGLAATDVDTRSRAVTLTARAAAGVAGVGLAAVGLHALRTVRSVLRR